MRRVMSIWFPALSLDLRRRARDGRLDGPFATISELKNAWRVVNVTEAAKRAGIISGMSVTDARAICPDLLTEPCDMAREERLLRAIQRWADKLSPVTALDHPDGLLLDIKGCVHLFGSEREMANIAIHDLEAMSVSSRIGICDTQRGAWALARFGSSHIAIAPEGTTREVLAPLPITALNIEPKTVSDLRRAGLKTVSDLYPFTTAALARRFGLALTHQLSFALGYADDPISAEAITLPYAARMTLPEPISFIDDVLGVVGRLAQSICKRLEAEMKGARQFSLTVRCVDTGDHHLPVGFAKPCFMPDQVLQQLRPSLEALKIEFGADWFRLEAGSLEPLRPEQLSITTDNRRRDETARLQAVSTLGNRLGFDRVLALSPRSDHAPESEFAFVEAVQSKSDIWPDKKRLRPERIFPSPEHIHVLEDGRPPRRFQWRRDVYEAASVLGPERLSPAWWMRGDKRTRDYWIMKTQAGERLWLLTYPTDKTSAWYVAGRFA